MRRACLAFGAIAAIHAAAPGSAMAQEQLYSFSLPAQPLLSALAGFTAATGIQVVRPGGEPITGTSGAVQGSMTAPDALSRLLAGTGLGWRRACSSAVTLHVMPAGATEAAAGAEGGVVQLPELSVTAGLARSWEPVRGYVAQGSAAGSKTDMPILETSQTINVVTRDQMDIQGASTVGSALRYTPGVEGEILGAFGNNDESYARGFAMDYYLDGMRVLQNSAPGAGFQTSTFGLERIEVVRGPASVLYGQGSPAGIIAMTSRRPSNIAGGEVRLTAGNNGRAGAAFTTTGPLNAEGTLSYRLTGLGERGATQVEDSLYSRLSIAPAITWAPTERTSWTILANFTRDPDAGFWSYIPSQGTVTFNPNGRLDLRRNYGDPVNYRSFRQQYSVTSLFEHRFDDVWTVRQNLRWLRTRSSLDGLYPQSFASNLRDLLSVYTQRNMESNGWTADTQLQARFSTGPLSHTMLVGLDYQGGESQYLWYFDRTTYSCDVFAFNPCPPTGGPRYGAPVNNNVQNFNRLSASAQDQIAWGNFRLLLSGRRDWADSTTHNRNTGVTTSMNDDAWTGRAGLVYLLPLGFAPYVSFSQSFNPQTGTDISGTPFVPTRGEQYEAGIKYQPPDSRIFVTAAIYQLTQQNVLTPDPANPLFSVQTGEVRSRGFELEARANINENLGVIAGYSYLDNEVTSSNAGNEGLRPVLYPARTASAWLDYRFTDGMLAGLRLGGGVRYVGASWGDTANTLRVPAATLVDAMASYDFALLTGSKLQGMELRVNATNLGDKQYIRGCYSVAQCNVGLGRSVFATLSYRW